MKLNQNIRGYIILRKPELSTVTTFTIRKDKLSTHDHVNLNFSLF